MKRILTVLAAGTIFAATSSEAVEISVGYPYAHLFDTTYTKIMKNFKKDHPDIKVKFRAVYDDYEDATQVVLREAVSKSLPDVTMQGLNRQAIFVEKGIAKSLEPYIAKEANFEKDGYHKSMLDLGTFNGEVHGLPFSVSAAVGVCFEGGRPDGGIRASRVHLRSRPPRVGRQRLVFLRSLLYFGSERFPISLACAETSRASRKR